MHTGYASDGQARSRLFSLDAMGRLRELSARPGARRRWAVLVRRSRCPDRDAGHPRRETRFRARGLLPRRCYDSCRPATNSPYQGYAETSGRLSFPDLGQFGDVAALLSETTRLRIWVASSTHYRIDQLSTAGEHDYYRDGESGYEWNSGNRFATVITRYPGVTQPSAPMVTPPALARRLLDGVPASAIQRIGARRDAGHVTVGLRVPSADPRSLIDHVDVWVDPDSGQPLAVSIVPRNPASAAFDSRFLSVSYTAPSQARLSFHPEKDPTAIYGAGVDGSFDNVSNHHPLPPTLAGLRAAVGRPRRHGDVRQPIQPGRRLSGRSGARVCAARQPGQPDPTRRSRVASARVRRSSRRWSAALSSRSDHHHQGYLVVSTLTRPALEQLATDLARATR